MNIYAYANIERLTEIAQKNNIVVPRLHGYCLMSEEPCFNEKEQMDSFINIRHIVTSLCTSVPFWTDDASRYKYGLKTDKLCRKYLGRNYNDDFDDFTEQTINWNKIHGKKRRVLKFAIKNKRKRIKAQYDIWNKYVGRADVLYIHARIGGYNWETYKENVIHEPWFLEKVDDYEDSTYCDIYAKLNVL